MLEAATGDEAALWPAEASGEVVVGVSLDVSPAPSGGLPRGPEPDGAFPGW